MKISPLLLFFVTFFCITNTAYTQNESPKKVCSKLKISHSGYGSIGLIYIGLGYDTRFRLPNTKVDLAASIGYGAGVFGIPGLEYTTSFTNVPLSFTVLSNKGKHSFESGLTIEYKNTTTTITESAIDNLKYFDKYVAFMPTLGYRYQENGFSPLIKVQGALGAGVSNQMSNIPGYAYQNGHIIIDGFIRASVGFSF
jgi:hypothetical protein